MTLHKLTAGDGYLYLMRHVAKADADSVRSADGARTVDAAGYYTAHGNPPGVWLGAGARVLGLAGSTVTETQMRNLFGVGAHPDAERIQAEFLAEHVRAGMTDRRLRELAAAAVRQAQLGRRFAEYRPLPPLAERVADRVAALQAETGRAATVEEVARIRAAESRRAAGAVAGFDLVFTPVKSLALLWALDPRAEVREAIRHAHEAAMTETLAFLEANAAHTRTGRDGLAQLDTTGLVAVAFTHYDSRAGDPNLHTHVAVSNKVQGTDGVWRALDARGLHALAVTASEHYNTRIQAHVADRLTIGFEAREVTRGRQPVVEVAGIPQQVLDHFSRRRAQLEARYDQLLADYRAAHSRDPDFATSRALAERANLETRRAKGPVRSLADMRAAWREDLHATFGPHALAQVMATVTTRSPHQGPGLSATASGPVAVGLVPGTSEHARLVDVLARQVADQVANSRSTWTIWNLRAEAERALRHPAILTAHGLGAATAGQLAGLAEAVADRAAGPGISLRLDPPALITEPASLRRADGASVFARHGADRYTSQAVLDAEHRLLAAATTISEVPAAGPSRQDVERILAGLQAGGGRRLDAGQRELVTVFAADSRTLVVGLGPAGTGKTTAMRALRDVLEQTRTAGAGGGLLVPLATSAHAAAVLAADLGIPAENVHKFLHDHTTGSPSRIPLSAGDVVLVDEAGMAGTPNLDRLLTLVQAAGARLRLLGDDRQLAAVESGGALRLLATEAGAVKLDVVHRFADPAEAAATLHLRTGDHRALGFYQARGRIHGGSLQDMTDRAYTAWLADVHAGRTSVLATTTTTDVTRLAARARADRVAAGQVEPGGVLLHDGNTAGVGDWILTRRNDRRLTSSDRRVWVRNGDGWRVVHRRHDGALTVQHLRDGARLVLPPDYVTAHVELLYATTAHRVQGATVDTAHALITEQAAREHLYVLATRARHATHLYVQTHQVLPVDEDDRVDRRAWDPAGLDATVTLQRILDREAAEPSATQALRDAQTAATSLATLVPRYEHAVAHLTTGYYVNVLRTMLTPEDFAEVQRDDAAPSLITEVRRAHQAGWQPERALNHAVHHARATAATWDADGAGSGRSMTWLVTEELRGLAASVNPPPHLHQPEPGDLTRYAALLADHGIDLDRTRVETALDVPQLLRAGAFDDPVPGRPPGEITTSTYRQDVTRALPAGLARRILQAPDDAAGWRTLQVVLRRAELAGHDATALLASPAVRAGVPENGPAAVHLAEHLTRVLADHPTPALVGIERRGPAGVAYAWNHLAWTMKAAEDHGTDPAALLPDADRTATHGQVPAVVAAWLHVQNHAGPATRRPPSEPVLPWAPAPVSGTVTDPDETAYLDELRDLISGRLTALRGELETAVLAGKAPAWAQNITTAYARYEHTRPRWLDEATVVAAFREQHLVPGDDPRADAGQPLGPHPEPAPPGDRTHARAHAEAAQALARAWEIAHPVGTRRQDAATPNPGESEVRRQLATAVWTALTTEQKTAVASTVLARLGTLPAPTHPAETVPAQPGASTASGPAVPAFSGLDEALAHPARAADLHRALIDHGHLPDPDTGPQTTSSGSARERPVRSQRRSPAAPRPPVRGGRQRHRTRRDVEPEQPVVEQHRRYDPQPGRIEPQPGRQYRL